MWGAFSLAVRVRYSRWSLRLTCSHMEMYCPKVRPLYRLLPFQCLPRPADLSTAYHLKKLRLALPLTYPRRTADFVASLKLPPSLEEITIFVPQILRYDAHITSRVWDELDTLLGGSELKCLKITRIILEESALKEGDRLVVREYMETRFPRLRAKRILQLEHKEVLSLRSANDVSIVYSAMEVYQLTLSTWQGIDQRWE